MPSTKSKKRKPTSININEEPVIQNIRKIRNKLINIFSGKDIASVHFINVSQIDLSGIQLMISLKKSCLKQNCDIKIQVDDIPPDYMELLVRTGFKEVIAHLTQ